jgi:D-alanyl-D-alanine carboxypeptidase
MTFNPSVLLGLLALGINSAQAVDPMSSNNIVAQVEEIRRTYEIPAVAFGVVKDGEIVLQGALGVRRLGGEDLVTTQDLFHIGSNTKSVTAFIAGRLVDQKKLSWDTRFFDLFPDLKTNSNPSYYKMTLRELLSHRTGLTSFKDGNQWETIKQARAQFNPTTRIELKLAVVHYALKENPAALTEDGSSHYSNLGYLLAAMMLERASGKSYEELIQQLDADLKVDFRIGWPQQYGADQPQGNVIPIEQGFGQSTTLGPMPKEIEQWQPWNDWVFLCRPAGDLCVSVTDFLYFLDSTMSGRFNRTSPPRLDISREILRGQMGWGSHLENGMHYHDATGSLCTFFSTDVIIEESKVGVVVMMNTGDYHASKGMYQIRNLLEEAFASR